MCTAITSGSSQAFWQASGSDGAGHLGSGPVDASLHLLHLVPQASRALSRQPRGICRLVTQRPQLGLGAQALGGGQSRRDREGDRDRMELKVGADDLRRNTEGRVVESMPSRGTARKGSRGGAHLLENAEAHIDVAVEGRMVVEHQPVEKAQHRRNHRPVIGDCIRRPACARLRLGS